MSEPESEPVEVIEPGTVEAVRVAAVLRPDVYRRALPDPFAFLDAEVLDLDVQVLDPHFPDLGGVEW